MHIIKIDPRALKDNPDDARRLRNPRRSGDALMVATIKAVGIIQPPVVSPEADGGNGFIIQAGHRRTRGAIAAELEEIEVIVTDAADDGGAMRSMVENIAREPLNPVDQWRAIERLVALGWTEEGIAAALSLSVRQITEAPPSRQYHFPPCWTRWRRATCPTSGSSGRSPLPRLPSRRRFGRRISRRRTRPPPGGL